VLLYLDYYFSSKRDVSSFFKAIYDRAYELSNNSDSQSYVQKSKIMKRIMIAVLALVFNMFLFSCTTDSVAETDELYEIQATEGDDGDVNEVRDDD
jgi:hypothetical protein